MGLVMNQYQIVSLFFPKGRYVFDWGGVGGGVGSGYFRNISRKKSWPSHFPEWINA